MVSIREGFLRFALVFCWVICTAVQASTLEVKHYQAQERYVFGLKLLDLALSKVSKDYLILGPDSDSINEARGELEVIEGRLDLQFLSTNLYRESRMIPIKIPVYRGLLGLRLLLVTPARAAEISGIKNLHDLRSFHGLHGTHWGDLPVYEANQLPVVSHVKYRSLFKMLIAGRADYFHRGVSEIWPEQERHANNIMIAEHVALFYEHPVYFFVGKHRPGLAIILEQGLNVALQDGSFQELFMNEYQSMLDKADLASRRILYLENPVVPEGTPPVDTRWWLPADVLIR